MSSVDDGLAPLEGIAAIPRDNGEVLFNEPWEAAVFGVAVTLTDQGTLEWEKFRENLVKAVTAANGCEAYYESWTKALHWTILDANVLSADEIDALTAELLQPH